MIFPFHSSHPYLTTFHMMTLSLLAKGLAELCIELVQLHLDPDHLDVSLVLEGAHVADVAGEGDNLPTDEEAQVEQSVEDGVAEEVADLIDEVPVPLAELD